MNFVIIHTDTHFSLHKELSCIMNTYLLCKTTDIELCLLQIKHNYCYYYYCEGLQRKCYLKKVNNSKLFYDIEKGNNNVCVAKCLGRYVILRK